MEKKEYWEIMIESIVLIFATYTITKDLVDENTWMVIANSSTISALIYAGIVDAILTKGLCIYLNRLTKKGKINQSV